ncbi:energy-coupling factor transporter transmembrane component T [Paraliobacillus sp. JSM ZJ581]|uniref:energy-coupling factor transporter transmembrane component T n=1 Tax=Paraliobacillus sp. JSM ZJ581 TaxID=3342118 RepID=UPI0035A93B09
MQDTYIQAVTEKKRVKLDPRTKIVVLLLINLSTFTANAWYVMALAAIIPLSLFILSKRYYFATVLSIIYVSSLLLYVFLINETSGVLSIIIAMLTSLICRMGPGLLMGYYLLTTTTVSEFIAAMERIHLPRQMIIPLSVIFRFFPTIKEESSAITDAMRMRGISFGKSRGGSLALIEYRLIPLFISCVKIGEELSCSALTRGLGSSIKRTNICKIGFGFTDICYTVFATITFLLLLRTKGV